MAELEAPPTSSPPNLDPEAAPAAAPESTRKAPSPLLFLRGGHRLNVRRGGVTFLAGSLGAFLLMANDRQWRWGVPVGFLLIVVAILGVLDLIGSFDDHMPWQQRAPRDRHDHAAMLPPARVDEQVRNGSAALVPGLGFLASLAAAMILLANHAYANSLFFGSYPIASSVAFGLGVTISSVLMLMLGFQLLDALGIVDAKKRPLHEREGFWLLVLFCFLFIPMLGGHSLIDPWETHYGEVSREVLARDDWISIWWAEEGFFVSKPILDFWLQALAMATFGAGYLPDQMIAPAALGQDPTHPEWIVRLPSLLLSAIGLYLAYRAIAQVYNRRTGLVAALVLATCSYWAMLTHQSITDLPFVASLTASMSLLLLGLTTDDEKTVKAVPIRFGKNTFSISGYHLAIGVVLLCALPQALYLLSRNMELVTQGGPVFGFGFAPKLDEFRAGSGHECWLPAGHADAFERVMRTGKWPCDVQRMAHPYVQPALQAALWLSLIGLLLYLNRNERRISRLCFVVAWVFAAISVQGKGVAGFLVPIAVAGAYVVTAKKWKALLRMELISGFIVLAIVALPWWIASFVRQGDEFIQNLIVHHMFKRAFDHVHDTNTGDDVSIRYFVWQLGYGLFPWTGLIAGGLLWWARKRVGQAWRKLTTDEERQRDTGIFLIMWFMFTWGLFTYMKTKFHHYVFPAVPPAALLTGIMLSEAMGHGSNPSDANTESRTSTATSTAPLQRYAGVGRQVLWLAVTALGVSLCAYGIARLLPGSFFGTFDNTSANVPSGERQAVGLLIGCLGAAVAIGARYLDPHRRQVEEAPQDAARDQAFAAVAVSAAIAVALVTRDLASRPMSDIKGQERLIQLFTYRYDRLWPLELSFSPALLGFGVTVVLLCLALAVRSVRRQAATALLVVAGLYSAWNLDVYMVRIAPHWGQRPLFEAYYRDRRSPKEPLVAFEMNWKGENFYSGGRLIEFGNGMNQGPTKDERGSERLRGWLIDLKRLADQRMEPLAIYFVSERGRLSRVEDTLRNVFGAPPNGRAKWTEELTTDRDINKFIIVRARIR